MDPADRLAAYLADELRADERAELEAALARDPGLRRMLAAMRRADEAVSALDPPAPPPGFDDRLDAAIDDVLDETLGPVGPTAASGPPDDPAAADVGGGPWSHRQAGDDELAARRRRRGPATLVGAAAAGLVLLVGGVVVTQVLDGDAPGDVAMDADLDVAEEEAADDTEVADEGPTVVADDREVDLDDLDALLAADELTRLAGQRLDELTGADVARAYQVELGQRPALDHLDDDPAATSDADAPEGEAPTADVPDEGVEDDAAADSPDAGTFDGDADEEAAEDDAAELDGPDRRQDARTFDPEDLPELRTRQGEVLDEGATQDLARCLGEVLAGGPDAIPVYAELATFDGTDAVILGLITTEPATGEFTRREVWALDRADCQVLRFSQDDADR